MAAPMTLLKLEAACADARTAGLADACAVKLKANAGGVDADSIVALVQAYDIFMGESEVVDGVLTVIKDPLLTFEL